MSTSDGTGTQNQVPTWNHPKKGFRQAFFGKFFSSFIAFHFEKSSNIAKKMSKNEEKPC